MLEKITITNVQSHKNTKLVFHKNVTTIIGLSDSGKSALIRAMDALIYREPIYVRHTETDASIEGVFSDYLLKRCASFSHPKKCPTCKQPVVARKCSCGEMITPTTMRDYYIENDVTTAPIEKFGVFLPENIQRKIRMIPITFIDFKERINTFNQFDDLFFIGRTYAGGVRNKILSSLVPDSEKVDTAIKSLTTNLNTQKASVDFLETQLLSTQEFVKTNKQLRDNIDTLTKEITTLESKLNKVKDNHITLTEQHQQLKQVNTKLNILEKVNEIKITPLKNTLIKIEQLIVNAINLKQIQQVVNIRIVESKVIVIPKSDIVSKLANLLILQRNIHHLPNIPAPMIPKLDGSIELNRFRLMKWVNVFRDSKVQETTTERDKFQIDASIALKRKELRTFMETEAICPLTNKKFCKDCVEALS